MSRIALFFVAVVFLSGCAISGTKRVDRSQGSAAKGFVEFLIDEKADFSIMREPVTIYITRDGEMKALGFVGADVAWSPAGYVHQLVIAEVPGTYTYGYTYQTMGKDIVPIAEKVGIAFLGLAHSHGIVTVDVKGGETKPVTFMLGPKEVKGTLVSKRLDPSQFRVQEGDPYEGPPRKIQE